MLHTPVSPLLKQTPRDLVTVQRDLAVTALEQIRNRLEAWRDDAAMKLRRYPLADVERYRTLRDNYGALVQIANEALSKATE